MSNDKIPRPSMHFDGVFLASQYSELDNSIPSEQMESNIPDWYDMLDIESSLLDQFNNNNIIELELSDQRNKHSLSHYYNMSNLESNLLD